MPPPGLLVGDVVASIRLTVDAGNRNLVIGTSGKSGVALFDASPGLSYSIQLAMEPSPTNAVMPYKVIKPDNTVLLSGSIGGNSYPPSIHLPSLSAAGTYSLLLSPGATTLNVNLRVETDPLLVVDGPAVTSNLDAVYQSARYVFDAMANQPIGIGISHLTFVFAPAYSSSNARLRIFRPDGVEIAASDPTYCYGVTTSNPGGNCDTEFVAPMAGRYTFIFEDTFQAYGQYSVTLNSEVTGTLLPDASQVVSVARAGQDARFTFAANAGDSLLAWMYLPSRCNPRPEISISPSTSPMGQSSNHVQPPHPRPRIASWVRLRQAAPTQLPLIPRMARSVRLP